MSLSVSPARPRRLPPARIGVMAAAGVGVLLAIGVIGWFGAGRVFASIASVGVAGFALYCGYSLLTFIWTGGAWWVLAVGQPLRRWPLFAWARLLREAAADILPFSAIGGVVVGARGVMLKGVPAAVTYGSIALELVTEIVSQIAFMTLGLVLLSQRLTGGAQRQAVLLSFAAAIGVLVATIAVLVIAQRRGFDLLGRLTERILPKASAGLAGVKEVIADLHRRPGRLALSVALHGAGWLASAGGSWMALRLMGAPVSFAAVIAVESLLSAVKSAAFAVPNAVGVQEAAYALIGQMFGISGEMGVALSLLRRAKDLTLGAPTLLSWQALESRRLLERVPA